MEEEFDWLIAGRGARSRPDFHGFSFNSFDGLHLLFFSSSPTSSYLDHLSYICTVMVISNVKRNEFERIAGRVHAAGFIPR